MLLGACGCLHVLHGGTGDGSGEGTAGEFTFPMPLGNAFGEERCARGVQRGIQSGSIKAHWPAASEDLRFSWKNLCNRLRQSASMTPEVISVA